MHFTQNQRDFERRTFGSLLNSAKDTPAADFAPWGPDKIVYLAHPSDAISFFSFDLWRQAPDWLTIKQGADVSPYLTWYPLGIMWQVGLDMLVTRNVPYGHGHNYSVVEYVRAWVELEADGRKPDTELQPIITTCERVSIGVNNNSLSVVVTLAGYSVSTEQSVTTLSVNF